MPYSDDEYDSQSGFASETSNAQNLSKAELRKTNKPIMEKKRRARINNCLNELKDLLLDAMNKDPARHSKLEKADILELTVKHLQALQRRQLAAAVAADPAVLRRFRAGFGDCAGEVKRYLSRVAPPTPPGLKTRLGAHLNTCLTGIERLAPPELPVFPELHRPDFRDTGDYFDRADLDPRRSAFHYVRRPTSPPLSPISCDSACDSSTEPETPPRPKISLIPPIVTFPTPPSRSASDQDSSPETQKPTVSSTTISPESRTQPAALDLKSRKYEPLSIVIDVENYKMGIDASPKRPLDYRHKLKRTAQANSRLQPEERAKIPRFDVSAEPTLKTDNVQTVRVSNPEVSGERPQTSRSVISHTAESLASSSAGGSAGGAGQKVEADTSSRAPDPKAQGSGDAMWRPW